MSATAQSCAICAGPSSSRPRCWSRASSCWRSQRFLEHRVHPGFGFLAAFAEAATIGGLADWYAVVVLFRRPLGLPIPHTAIIPANQQRIAQSLGEFVETHFLAPDPVAAKL